MSIYYERRLWEDAEAYLFCSTFDYRPICVVAKIGDGWELRFLRGSSNPGPFPYASFEKAKRHVFRYVEPRERRITGGPPRPNSNASTPPASEALLTPREPLHSIHPSRLPRRKGWWKVK
ncbi:hypothetical protein [Dyella terrae]|uniref:hypothetical protein n=1 Tax=Dyella terrae TaxID=522259 RepID=UPI001EFE1EFA|nr:hypothetical protein [Dyella terrae]ULU25276.1 hypothetical protein DYST_02201 [Dyella terrae]